MMLAPLPVALTVAGSDSGGGAGIQADLKTFSRFGVFGASAVTALTAQNTAGVTAVVASRPDFVRAQIEAVLSDLDVRAAKTGMLADADIIETVAASLARHTGIPLVVDPVMVATSGVQLLATDAVATLRDRLLPRAALVTPNLPEARLLTGLGPDTTARELCAALLDRGAGAVLLKGGHDTGDTVEDLLAGMGWERRFRHPRQPGGFHGTGCCLAAGITAGLALGNSLEESVETASAWLQSLIARARPGRCGAASILPFESGAGPFGA